MVYQRGGTSCSAPGAAAHSVDGDTRPRTSLPSEQRSISRAGHNVDSSWCHRRSALCPRVKNDYSKTRGEEVLRGGKIGRRSGGNFGSRLTDMKEFPVQPD